MLGMHVQGIVGASWSVSAEIACYVAFPVLAFVFARAPALFLLLVAGAAGGIALVIRDGIGLHGGLDVVSTDSVLPVMRAASGFITGMAVFGLARCSAVDCGADLLATVASVLVIVGLAIGIPDGLIYPDLALLVVALTKDGLLARRLFANSPLQGIGLVSYSLYLGHSLFLSTSAHMVRLLIRYADADLGSSSACSCVWEKRYRSPRRAICLSRSVATAPGPGLARAMLVYSRRRPDSTQQAFPAYTLYRNATRLLASPLDGLRQRCEGAASHQRIVDV